MNRMIVVIRQILDHGDIIVANELVRPNKNVNNGAEYEQSGIIPRSCRDGVERKLDLRALVFINFDRGGYRIAFSVGVNSVSCVYL